MLENRITLFVGDTDESLSAYATAYDSTAFLIDQSNYKEFLTSQTNKPITVYTSLGDLPKDLEVVYNILMTATNIVYVPPAVWSDGLDIDPASAVSSVRGLTENMLLLVSSYRPVENLELCYFNPTANPVVDARKSNKSQLWFAGCSITFGDGVKPSQRYGQLVADSLGLPVSFLALNGSSIAWAADQILRADINEGDIIVWGITSTERLNFINQNKLINIGGLPVEEQRATSHKLFSENTFYTHLYAIEQVINYCKKHKTTLLLLGLLTSSNILRYLKSKSNYFHFPHKLKFSNGIDLIEYTDLGTDNQHPGIKQHELYKDFVLTNLLKL